MTNLLLIAFLLLIPVENNETKQKETFRCKEVWATLHYQFDSVLSWFPDRYCPYCDGYIATIEKEYIGKEFVIVVDGNTYYVSVADAARETDKKRLREKYGEVIDIDVGLWPKYQLENNSVRPIKVELCGW